MKLSIVTINYNDAIGLKKTLDSVAMQHIPVGFELEHIIVDGGSTDGSVDVIKNYEQQSCPMREGGRMGLSWVSERDKGIYHAMNKGVEIALGKRKVNSTNNSEPLGEHIWQKSQENMNRGECLTPNHYVQILNSGDVYAKNNVIHDFWSQIQARKLEGAEIVYGNMIKAMPDGKMLYDRKYDTLYTPASFLYFYCGTMNHDTAWIRRDLYERFGLYDEQMKICSDWKWFVDAVALGNVCPQYIDMDITIFDMNGVSESGGKNRDVIQCERRAYLKKVLPNTILNDYEQYGFVINQYRRLKHYRLYGLMYLIERVLFKLEKWGILR